MLKADAQEGLYAELVPPEAVHGVTRRIHFGHGDVSICGVFVVRWGSNLAARALARVLRLPRPGEDVPVRVHILRTPGRERWVRWFGERRIESVQFLSRGELVERVGPLRLRCRLETSDGALRFVHTGASLGLVRLPRAIAPRVESRVVELGGLMHVSVRVEAPLVGTVFAYEGCVREG